MPTTNGTKVGGFVLVEDADGMRYAVRASSIGTLCDADPCRDETIMHLYGGRIIRVGVMLDEVLTWFS